MCLSSHTRAWRYWHALHANGCRHTRYAEHSPLPLSERLLLCNEIPGTYRLRLAMTTNGALSHHGTVGSSPTPRCQGLHIIPCLPVVNGTGPEVQDVGCHLTGPTVRGMHHTHSP